MEIVKLRKWDSAIHLQTEEDIEAYLDACLEEAAGDTTFIAHAESYPARPNTAQI